MTTSTVMTLTDELLAEIEGLADSVKGWNMTNAFQEPEEGFLPEDWEWYVGQIDEDDNRYPVLNVNAHQYDSEDSEKLARYYAACNRDTILSITQELRRLRAENAELAKDAGRFEELAKQANVNCRNAACYLRKRRPDLATICSGWCDAIDTAMASQ